MVSTALEKQVGEAMQKAWDEICSDTGCHPLDITHQGRKLFFQPAHWVALVAKYLTDDSFMRCTYCGFIVDLRWQAEFPKADTLNSHNGM